MSQFQFVMRSGPTPGMVFPLEGDQLLIGRDAANSIAINDAEISRKHSRLTFQGGKYVIEDLGSPNGTFINGQRLAGPAVLKPGDVVSLGEQIVLMYDAINVDTGATIASPRAARMVPPPVQQPVVQPVQQTPTPVSSSAPVKKTNLLPFFIGGGVLIFLCFCAGFFWWVDATYRCCVFFPFISGC